MMPFANIAWPDGCIIKNSRFSMTFNHDFVCLIDKTVKSEVYNQLTFDIIMGLGGISRLGTHPYPLRTYQDTL